MTTPANNLDTTSGGGGDIDGGANDPAYRAPTDGVPDADGNSPDTSDNTADSGGANAGAGRTGDTDDHTSDPQALGDTTTPNGGFGVYRTGDTDDHTKDPQALGDSTVLGGGVGASNTGQVYRAPTNDVPAGQVDTTGRGGYVNVNPGSPDAAVVGGPSGVNPNAEEPALTASGYDVMGTRDTQAYGSPPISGVPAGTGTPGAPTGVTAVAVAHERVVVVSWTPPSNAAATGVRNYVVQSNTNGTQQAPKNATSVEFEDGLIGGNTYTFTVYAESANGSGTRSAVSAPVTIPTGDLHANTTRADGL